MDEFLNTLLKNQLLMLSLAVVSGLLLGQVRFKSVSLGSSGVLVTGLALGMLNVKVSFELFNWNLMLFVVAVGLLSAEDIVMVVKKYGMKFILLSLVVTAVGALVTYLVARMAVGVDPLLIAGDVHWSPDELTRPWGSPGGHGEEIPLSRWAIRSPTPSGRWLSSFSSSWHP